MKKILVIEDDQSIALGLTVVLKEDDYEVSTESDGKIGFETALNNKFDIIVLDIMLPNMNGFDICKGLREHKVTTPILLLSSKKEEFDKIVGFENGADDYMTKPFSIMELRLRIKAITRRSQQVQESVAESKANTLKIGSFVADSTKFDVYFNNQPIGLSVKEFHLFKFLMENIGKVISRDEILDKVWGYDSYPSTRTIDNYILSIRKKIEPDPANPKYVLTVPTIGYKLNIENSNQ